MQESITFELKNIQLLIKKIFSKPFKFPERSVTGSFDRIFFTIISTAWQDQEKKSSFVLN